MGLSSSKKTTKTSENRLENATRSPTNPVMATQAMEDFLGRVKSFGAYDPYRFVAPASDLQEQAFEGAGQLGNSGMFGRAAQMAQGVAGAGAPSAKLHDYRAPDVGAAAGYKAPALGPAAQARGVTIDPAQTASAASLLENIQAYQSPYAKDVVGAAMADFDSLAGRQRADLAARGAKAGALGSSRFGFTEGAFEGEVARARNSQLANLLDQGFRTAAQLAEQDAGRRQQAGLFNADAANARALNQAGLAQQANLFNAGAQNDRAVAQGQLDQSAGQFNTDARNSQSAQQAALEAAARQFSAGAQNQNSQFNAQMQGDALARQLQAAGLLGDLGNSQQSNQRQNLALTADLGAEQQRIEQMRRMAIPAQIDAMAGWYNQFPLGLWSGENVQGTVNSRGTNVTKSSPSLFQMLLEAGSKAASAFGAGG